MENFTLNNILLVRYRYSGVTFRYWGRFQVSHSAIGVEFGVYSPVEEYINFFLQAITIHFRFNSPLLRLSFLKKRTISKTAF